ncbi:hypothetical protein [Vagococcus carniphilus]|uniref:hypothetical protein n=1 Tax=Vagococcus carniphilus TaxID=218144 RepID=UPI003BAD8C0E
MTEIKKTIKQNNIIMTSRNKEDELILKMVDNQSFLDKKKYKEVFLSEGSFVYGNAMQSLLQVANKSMTLTDIAKQSPNGLFSATVDPVKLSKLKNGTVSTMVHNSSGKLEKHAGFTEVSLKSSLNPVMALSAGMQVMSMVSGTYYLNKINVQLAEVDNKLEELLQIHHDESIGKLIAARKSLSEIAEREFVDGTDLNSVRSYKKTVNEIQEEYSFSLHRKEEELLSKKEIDISKLEDINFYMSVIYESSKISLLSEIIEIGSRMKMDNQSEIIEGLTKQLEKNYKNSFYFNSDEEFGKLMSKIKNNIMKKRNKQKQNSDKAEEIISKVPSINLGIFPIKLAALGFLTVKDGIDSSSASKKINNHSETYKVIKDKMEKEKNSETIDITISEILKLPYKETEILYIPNDGTQRIFIPVE